MSILIELYDCALTQEELTCDRNHWQQSVRAIGYWKTAQTMAAQGYTMQETKRMLGQPPAGLSTKELLAMYDKDELPNLLRPQAH